MKSALEAYPEFWKGMTAPPILAVLSHVHVVRWPEEALSYKNINKDNAILVLSDESLPAIQQALEAGFHHCLSPSRKDFALEILSAALMICRPEVLVRHQIPFFFRRFLGGGTSSPDRTFVYNVRSSHDKQELVYLLENFLSRNERLARIKDLALEINEELFKNAFLHGAISPAMAAKVSYGEKSEITLSGKNTIEVFAAFDDEMLIIGCHDTFGKMSHGSVLKTVFNVGKGQGPHPRPDARTAKGIGLRICLENSASMYFYGQEGVRTIVSCGLLLGGLKANLSESKHVHLSISPRK